MTNPLRIAVLGAGYWGPNLIRVIDQLPDSELAVVCDKDDARLDRIRTSYRNTEFTTDSDAVFANNGVDAVVVALPASLHYEYALKALAAGKHCFVEKPLATTGTECAHLIETAKANGVTLMVGHTFEFNAAVLRVKEAIDSGELGQIYHFFSQRINLGQVRNDIDVIWNLAPHDISIILFWMGGRAPVWISAQGFSYLQPGISDLGTITMEFEDGTTAHIIVSWLSPDKIRKMMVTGSKKMIIYDDTSPDEKIRIYDKGADIMPPPGSGKSWADHNNFGEFQVKLRSGDLLIPRIDFVEPLKVECSHFVECARSGNTPIADGQSGLRVTKILEAASLSAKENGKRILYEDVPG